jgi:hypothetical protein
MADRRRLTAMTLLRDCPDSNVGMALSAPISDRLDALVSMAEASGDRTNRKELVASLILAASPDGAELIERIRTYRLSSVGAARLDGKEAEAPLSVSRRRPGPRPRQKYSV